VSKLNVIRVFWREPVFLVRLTWNLFMARLEKRIKELEERTRDQDQS
jgi:hypothetical protein